MKLNHTYINTFIIVWAEVLKEYIRIGVRAKHVKAGDWICFDPT